MVTKNVYFSLLTHTNQLLLVTLCHTPAGIENSKVGRDDGRRRTDAVRTDRRVCRNSYVDRHSNKENQSIKLCYEYDPQCPEVIFNKVSNSINKTYIGLASMLQGFQKCIVRNPSKEGMEGPC